MAVIKEFRCLDCDTFFESSDPDPVCPSCTATEPERAFLTPPSIKDGKTSIADREQRALAETYGLSDMNNKEGRAVRSAPAPEAAPQFASTGDPKVMQMLGKLGGHSDSMSAVLPALRQMGGPRSWQRVPDRK